MKSGAGFLTDDTAMAAVILWASGKFDTSEIAKLLSVREDAVWRTIHMARDHSREARVR